MIRSLRISSPGKLILCGEHAVVYGKKALACAVNLRTYLSSSLTSEPIGLRFTLADLGMNISINQSDYNEYKRELTQDLSDLDALVDFLTNNQRAPNKQYSCVLFLLLSVAKELDWSVLSRYSAEIKSEIPLASGLGSSASFSVCLSTYMLLISGVLNIKIDKNISNNDLETINKYAFYLEKIFHGKPSGIDNSVSTFGSYIMFQKGNIDRFKSNVELPVLIVNSSIPKQTREQVQKVRNLYDKHTTAIECVFNAIDNIVDEFFSCLKAEDTTSLGQINELVRINQGLLYSIQISNYQLDSIVSLANKHGLSCKITGAGGGGCCFILLKRSSDESLPENDLSQLIENLQSQNFSPFQTKLGSNGVRIEQLEF